MKAHAKKNIRELENEFYDSHVSYSIIALANLISLNTMKNTLDGTQLTVNEWRVLRLAFIYGSICAADVINLFGLDKTTTGRAISRLKNAGLVKLSVDSSDKRRTNVTLTAAGTRLHHQVIKRDSVSDDSIEQILTAAELRSFHRAMKKLRLHVKDMLNLSTQAGDT